MFDVVVSKNLSNNESLAAYTDTPFVSFSQSDLGAFCSEIEKLV